MTRERLHDIRLAKAEINWYSVLINEYNQIPSLDWERAKKELEKRLVILENEEEDFDKEHKQVDCFGTFVAFTLCWDRKCGYYINYGWVLDESNTDLYAYRVGDFRPYYDEKSKKEWEQR